jgi:CBS domain containing-hemolysin-like protein
VNGFFVAAEYGLVTSRRTRIMELEHREPGRPPGAPNHSRPAGFISAMQAQRNDLLAGDRRLGRAECSRTSSTSGSRASLAVIFALLIVTYLHAS